MPSDSDGARSSLSTTRYLAPTAPSARSPRLQQVRDQPQVHVPCGRTAAAAHMAGCLLLQASRRDDSTTPISAAQTRSHGTGGLVNAHDPCSARAGANTLARSAASEGAGPAGRELK